VTNAAESEGARARTVNARARPRGQLPRIGDAQAGSIPPGRSAWRMLKELHESRRRKACGFEARLLAHKLAVAKLVNAPGRAERSVVSSPWSPCFENR